MDLLISDPLQSAARLAQIGQKGHWRAMRLFDCASEAVKGDYSQTQSADLGIVAWAVVVSHIREQSWAIEVV